MSELALFKGIFTREGIEFEETDWGYDHFLLKLEHAAGIELVIEFDENEQFMGVLVYADAAKADEDMGRSLCASDGKAGGYV